MAGEKRGKAVEAIIRYSLESLRGQFFPEKSEIFWDQKINDLRWNPDIFLPPTKDFNGLLILITFSGSETDSRQKFWRNLAEYFDARQNYPDLTAISVIAGTRLREKQLKAQKYVFNDLLLLNEYVSNKKLLSWLLKLSEKKINQGNLLDRMHEITSSDKDFLSFLNRVTNHISSALNHGSKHAHAPIHGSFWLVKPSMKTSLPKCIKETYFRRGIAKTLLFTSEELSLLREKRRISAEPRHGALIRGKILSKSIAGLTLADEEVLFAIENLKDVQEIINFGITDVGRSSRKRLWHLGEVERALNWCSENWQILSDEKKLYVKLASKATQPSGNQIYQAIKIILDLRLGRQGQEWIEDVVDATGEMRSILVGLIFPDFESGKTSLNSSLLKAVAKALALRIKEIKPLEKDDFSKAIDSYIRKEIETRLVCHGIDGVGSMIKLELLKNNLHYQDKYFLPSGISEKLEYSQRDLGTRGILISNQVYVHWKSVSEEGRNHKVKEMYARIFQSIRMWRKDNYLIRQFPNAFFLIIDGTWQKEDLASLVNAGWSKIFYPHEMPKFVEAVREALKNNV